MANRAIGLWLLGVSGGVYSIVTLGGFTRLKDIGVGCVDWWPLNRSRPATDSEWMSRFDRLKDTEEYKQYPGLSLENFKEVDTVSWAHKTLSTIVGAGLLLPAAYFWSQGHFSPPQKLKVLSFIGMFGALTTLGWKGAKEGLIHKKDWKEMKGTDSLKLGFELNLGMGLYGWMFWNALHYLRPASEQLLNKPELLTASMKVRTRLFMNLHIAYLGFFLGALTAALDAGKVYNNFPWFDNNWLVPDKPMSISPWYRNLYENKGTVQFLHRNVAYISMIGIFELAYFVRTVPLLSITRTACDVGLLLTLLQAFFGMRTLWHKTDVLDDKLHQINATVLLTGMLYALHTVRKPSPSFIANLMK